MERAFVDGCVLPRQMKREARHFNGDVVHSQLKNKKDSEVKDDTETNKRTEGKII